MRKAIVTYEQFCVTKNQNVLLEEHHYEDGTYAIQRPFVMVTKDGAALSDAAQAFLDFAMSPDAAEIIAAAGAVSANA